MARCPMAFDTPSMLRVRKFLRLFAVGDVNSGLFFRSEQLFQTSIAGLITLVGLVLITGLALFEIANIRDMVYVQT